MAKKDKTLPAKAVESPERGKVTRIRDHQSTNGYPSWRFSTVDRTGPFAWPIGQEIEVKILAKLHQFDSMKWPTIEGDDHHFIETKRLSKEAQDRLADLKQDDVDGVFSFHFSGKRRIIGIRSGDIVKLLWWDPEHKVCVSHKKHT
ncbi:hypothetical protein K5M33_14105 [Chromobacterium vaccinii]|nr:hypothetical protein [Chromobacterium vaccinii]MBX9357857.1 hypothetical protein [Chromobacterium vaccinii]